MPIGFVIWVINPTQLSLGWFKIFVINQGYGFQICLWGHVFPYSYSLISIMHISFFFFFLFGKLNQLPLRFTETTLPQNFYRNEYDSQPQKKKIDLIPLIAHLNFQWTTRPLVK